jgi:formate/nitrite transporter FocA (FNT family)
MTRLNDVRIDALLPAEMAQRAEEIGVSKANMKLFTMFALGVLAGIFIALGAMFATTVTAPTLSTHSVTGALVVTSLPFGISRVFGGLVFCLGIYRQQSDRHGLGE